MRRFPGGSCVLQTGGGKHTPPKKNNIVQVFRSSGGVLNFLTFTNLLTLRIPKKPSNGGVNDSVLRRVSGISKAPVLRSHDS